MASSAVETPAEDDEFFDADDSICSSSVGVCVSPVVSGVSETVTSGRMSLESSLQECSLAVNCFFNNQFDTARAIMKPWRRVSVYHAMGYGTLTYLQAIMTFEPRDISEAIDVLRESLVVCNKARRVVSLPETALNKFVRKNDYKTYTEVECHAELCYAECLLLRAVLNILEDESFLSLVRGGLKIRTCHSCYRECMQLLNSRDWSRSATRNHFEGGVRLGAGTFSLLISQLPSRVMKILEFVGLSGDKESGLSDLLATSALPGNIHRSLASLVLLAFHLIISPVLGAVSDSHLAQAECLLQRELTAHPNSALFLFFAGRLRVVRCQLPEGVELFNSSRRAQQSWPQLHHICYWELFWCHLFQCEWQLAAEHAALLLQESRWSRTVYSYLRAVTLYMALQSPPLSTSSTEVNDRHTEVNDRHTEVNDRHTEVDDRRRSMTAEIQQLMTTLPDYKQRIAGKSLTMEKFVIAKASRFMSCGGGGGGGGGGAVLPGYELMYLFNGFGIIGRRRELVLQVYSDVEREMRRLGVASVEDTECLLASSDSPDRGGGGQGDAGGGDYTAGDSCSPDERALLLFLHGVCLSHMMSPSRAELSLLAVTRLQGRIQHDRYLVPFAWLELALLNIKQQRLHAATDTNNKPNFTDAIRMLQHAKNDYKKYIMENRLHFRVHFAMSNLSDCK